MGKEISFIYVSEEWNPRYQSNSSVQTNGWLVGAADIGVFFFIYFYFFISILFIMCFSFCHLYIWNYIYNKIALIEETNMGIF